MAASADIRAIDDLEALAEIILSGAKTIKDFFNQAQIPALSFDQKSPLGFPDSPANVQEARIKLLDASKKINQLVTGPAEHLVWYCGAYNDAGCLRWVSYYDVPSAIPLDGEISYAELAAKTKLDENLLRRILRFLMTSNLFCESHPGHVAHTAGSKLLVLPGMKDLVAYAAVDCTPVAAKLVEATEKYGYSEEPTESAFNVASGSNLPVFVEWDQDLIRGPRFSRAMTALESAPAFSIQHALNGYSWSTVPPSSTIVDVGGATGQFSKAIANLTDPSVKFIVQDLPNVTEHNKSIPMTPELEGRITFQAYDFFNAQPVKGADIYFLRHILHDHPDKYAHQILRNIVQAMKPGHSKLIIMDQISPPVGVVPASQERMIRFMDIQMMILLNAKEREMSEWGALFGRAGDGKLKLQNVVMPEGSAMAVMELELEE